MSAQPTGPSSVLVAPSALSADFCRLGDELKSIESAGADWHHVDVMDGHFVPNLSFGLPVIASMNKVTMIPLDVHLMISNPQHYFERYAEVGADRITYHWEVFGELMKAHKKSIEILRDLNVKVGVSIKPGTPVTVLEDLLADIDQVLVMSVEPGFGGQSYMPQAEDKIAWLRAKSNELNTPLHIVVDGGINAETAKQAVSSGADVLVSGSYVYKATDRAAAIQSLR